MSNLFLAKYGSEDHINKLLKDHSHENEGVISSAYYNNPYWNQNHDNYMAKSDNIHHRIIGSSGTNSHKAIDSLLKDENYRVDELLSRNHHLGVSHIHTLIDRSKNNSNIREGLAWNPNLKAEHAKRLVDNIGGNVLHGLIATHMKVDTGAMDKENTTALLSKPIDKSHLSEIKKSEVYKKHFQKLINK